MGEGPRDSSARARRHYLSLWQSQANELADEQAKKGSTSKCRSSRAKLLCKGLVLGLVGEVPGSASRLREIQRLERCGAQGTMAAAYAAWEADGVPTRAGKAESHARQVLAHAHSCGDGQHLVLLEVRVLHRATCQRACGTVSRNHAKPAWRAPQTHRWQEPERRWLPGGANLACSGSADSGRGPGGSDESWVGLVCDGLGVDQLSVWHDSHESR